MTELWGVQKHEAQSGLAFARPLLEEGLNGGERLSMLNIEDGVSDGGLQLWIAWANEAVVKAVGVTELFNTATSKVACIVFATGDLKVLVSHIKTIEDWAAALGRTVEIFGRPGWSDLLPGYRIKHVLLEKKNEQLEA